MKTYQSVVKSIILCGVVLLTGALTVPAATITKDNNTTAITTGSAWLGGVAPGSGDIGYFDSTITGPLTIANAATAGSFGALQFTNIGGPVTIGMGSGTTITLANGTPTYQIDMSGAAADVTIASVGTTAYLRWASAAYNGISVTNGRTLTINANVSNQGNTKALTMTGGGNIIFNGGSTGGGGAMGFSLQGGTTLTLNTVGAWPGTLTVLNGTLNIGNDSALNGKTLTMGGTSSTNPVVAATGAAHTISSGITLPAVTSGNVTIAGTNNLTVNGLLTVSGGNRTLTVNSTGLTTFGGGVAMADSGTSRILTLNGSGNITISSNMVNGSTAIASALVYSGTGKLALSGTNTYAGSTTISSGELVGVTGGSISNTAAILIAAGATNGVQLAAAGGQFVCTNLVVTNASFMDFNFNGFTPSLITAPELVLGNLAMTNAVGFLVRNGSFGVGSYPLIKYTGTLSGTVTNLLTGLLPNRASGYISNDVATTKTIYLVVTNAGAEPLTWAAGSSTWDTANANWLDKNGNAATYADPAFDQVVFDDTSSGTPPFTVTLSSAVTPVSVTANLTNAYYTITGAGSISGSESLVKNGLGTLTLNTANAYTGGTLIAGGTIALNSLTSGATGCGVGTGTVTLTNGGALALWSSSSGDPGTSNGGLFTNAIVVPSGQSGTVSNAWRGTFSSTVTGGGTLNFNVNGTRGEVTGNNWSGYTGQINVTGGPNGSDFRLNNANTTVNFGTAALNLGSGVIMYEVGNYNPSQTITIGEVSGAGTMSGGTSTAFTRVLTYLVGGRNTDATFSGVIQDNARQTAVIKQGTGRWTLAGANTYTGPTLVSNGMLEVSVSLAATAVTNYVGTTLAGVGTFAGVVDLETGSTIAPGAAGAGNVGTLTFNGGLNLNSAVTNLMDVNSSANDSYVVASGQTLNIASGGVMKLNISSLPADGAYTLIDHTGATVSGGVANLTLTPTIYGSSSLSLVDNGNQIQLQISTVGTNALTWTTTGVAANNYWDVGTSVNWTNKVGLDMEAFQNGDTVTFDDSGAANSPVDVRSAVLPNGVVVNNSVAYTLANTTTFGQISGALTNGFVKSGAGALTMLTKNNYTGPTLLNGSGVVTVGDGSTLNTAISSGPVTNNTLLVFNQPDNSAIAGDLTGTGSLVKLGAGTLTVNGNATFKGTNLIDTGTLQLGTGGATAIPTNPFVLANGGTLKINRSGNYNVTNTITGTGSVNLGGTSTNIFGGTHTYLNNTYISGGLVQLPAANVIPNAVNVPGSTGWLILDGGATAGTLDINGIDLMVNALSGLGGTAVGVITNTSGSSTTNVLTINSTTDTGFAGKITENTGGAKLAIVKTGPYTQFLTGVNTFSGGVTISNGVLAISQAASIGTGTITLMGGALTNTASLNLYPTINLMVPAGQTGLLGMIGNFKMPNLYGSGILNLNVNGTAAGSGSGSYGNALGGCVNFTGTLNVTGMVANAKLVFDFNNIAGNGVSDGQLQNATVNLYGGVSLVGLPYSGGSGAQIGTLNVDSASILAGGYVPGGGVFTYTIGGLGANSDIEGTVANGGNSAAAIIKVGSGKLTLNGSDTYTGNTTVSAGSLIVGASSFMASSPVITVSTNAILDVSAASPTFGGTVAQTIAGYGAVVGNVSVVNGTIIPGGSGAVGTLSFANNLALTGNVTNTFDIAISGAGDQLAVAGTLDISGSGNLININALNTTILPGTYTLATFSGPLLSNGSPVDNGAVTNYVTLGGASSQIRFVTLSNSANALLLVVGTGSSLTWVGDGSANKWDLTNSPDWSGSQVFYQNDSVTFDDSSSNPTVNLTGTLAPNGITVASSSNYLFTSTGKLTANTAIAKSGTGTLTIANSGGNDYNGSVTVSGGVLKAGSATALGSTNGSTVISGTGALDVGGYNLGAEPVTVSGSGIAGAGAILNSGAVALNALQFVTLAGDTTFGGTNRWDIRTNALGAALTGNGHNLTKVSGNDIYLANVGNAGLSNVVIQAGRIGVQNNTHLGGTGTLILATGAGLDFWDTTVTNTKAMSVTNATVSSSSSANVYGGTINLNGTGTFTATTALQLNGNLNGAGGVLKLGASTLTLAGSGTYTGNTTISNGVLALIGTATIANSTNLDVTSGAQLDVSGLTGSFSLASGQTLKGAGSVKGNVTVAAGSTIAPGESAIGTLTVSNNVTLAGTNVMIVNTNASPNASKLVVGGTLAFGGTLVINNVGAGVSTNSTFTLFSAGGTGSFAAISPATPGTGLVWDTSALNASGILKVAAPAGPSGGPGTITNSVSGSTLSLSWPAGQGWVLEVQTNNLVNGVSSNTNDWMRITGSSSLSSTNIQINPVVPGSYYRLVNP